MPHLTSKDGTSIAFDRVGSGPSLILVDGALCYRAFGPMGPLAQALASHFTVYTYDRRGRGESGNGRPYAVEREIEDLDALVREAGGSAYAYGASSGGALALEAAKRGVAITKVAVYEPPYITDDTIAPVPDDYVSRLNAHVAAGRPGDAVKTFMRTVGTPGFFITVMQLMPMWGKLKAVAHTLPNDFTLMADGQKGKPFPPGKFAPVKIPALVMAGGKSAPWMRHSMQALASALPNARQLTLDGQTHMVKAKVQTPVLREFFLN